MSNLGLIADFWATRARGKDVSRYVAGTTELEASFYFEVLLIDPLTGRAEYDNRRSVGYSDIALEFEFGRAACHLPDDTYRLRIFGRDYADTDELEQLTLADVTLADTFTVATDRGWMITGRLDSWLCQIEIRGGFDVENRDQLLVDVENSDFEAWIERY